MRAITDAGGAKVETAIYRPFGEQSEWLLPGTPAPETKGWIGERYDADAGLQYLNARYYDPALGLFLQPDWFEVTKPGVGTNRFSYSFNDPVNGSDPGGNQTNGETMGDEFDSPSCEESGGCDYRLQNWASRIGRNLRAARDNPLEAFSGMVRGTVQDLAFGVENLPSSPLLGPVGTMAGAAQGVLESCKGSSGCNDYVYGEMTDAQQGGYLIGSVATGAAGLARAGIKGLAKTVDELVPEIAANSKGTWNFGYGTATRTQVAEMGNSWVGAGARVASDGKTLVSSDALRQYRGPSYKPYLDKFQANFEWRMQPRGPWIGNAHVDIVE